MPTPVYVVGDHALSFKFWLLFHYIVERACLSRCAVIPICFSLNRIKWRRSCLLSKNSRCNRPLFHPVVSASCLLASVAHTRDNVKSFLEGFLVCWGTRVPQALPLLCPMAAKHLFNIILIRLCMLLGCGCWLGGDPGFERGVN